MAQTGYTPISLYYSATGGTTPTSGNLVAGELAINTADGKLFYKDSAGVVQTIASKDTFNGIFSTISVAGNSVLATASGTTIVGASSGQGAKFEVVSPQGNGVRIVSTGLTSNSGGVLYFSNQVVSGYKDITGVVSLLQNSGTGVEAGDLLFYTANAGNLAARMTVSSVGYVGIGTVTPASNLEIRSASDIQSKVVKTGVAQINAGVDTIAYLYSDSAMSLRVAGTGNGTERMRIDTSGNIGIGTSTISGNSTNRVVIAEGSSSANLVVTRTSNESGALYAFGGKIYVGSNTNHPLAFNTNATERGRFDTSGNFYFNSGYGSVAVAYGCRAWVNFNGTGTISITGSGNISSLADIGVGDYRVNLSNAMPDSTYSCQGMAGNTGSPSGYAEGGPNGTGQVYVYTLNRSGSLADFNQVQFAIIR